VASFVLAVDSKCNKIDVWFVLKVKVEGGQRTVGMVTSQLDD